MPPSRLIYASQVPPMRRQAAPPPDASAHVKQAVTRPRCKGGTPYEQGANSRAIRVSRTPSGAPAHPGAEGCSTLSKGALGTRQSLLRRSRAWSVSCPVQNRCSRRSSSQRAAGAARNYPPTTGCAMTGTWPPLRRRRRYAASWKAAEASSWLALYDQLRDLSCGRRKPPYARPAHRQASPGTGILRPCRDLVRVGLVRSAASAGVRTTSPG